MHSTNVLTIYVVCVCYIYIRARKKLQVFIAFIIV